MTEITETNAMFGPDNATPQVDYACLLGEPAYRRLVPGVRTRMARHVATYTGVMERVELSWAGRVLAWLAVPFGRPLATHEGTDVPVRVDVFPAPDGGDTWRRHYEFGGGHMVEVSSVKRLSDTGLLVECLGKWLQMELTLFEQAGALVFESTAYRVHVGPFVFTLPALLNPGRTRVVHRDLGHGQFRFELTITHPLLGRLATQGGTFQ